MENKNILVVGASSGVGLALSKILLNDGCSVYTISRNEVKSIGERHFHLSMDILDGELSTDFLPDVLDGVVYCPGSINLKPIRSLSVEMFRNDYEINVIGAVHTIKASLSRLKKSTNIPSIVLFSTVAVQQGMTFHASIAAAKGAIEGITRSLASELAPRIRVNCIAPSLLDTPLASHILSSEERKEASNNRHPMKRVGKAEDVASAAAYLLSEKAQWITGQVLGVDGGLSTLR